MSDLTRELAEALGVPLTATRAVLTLSAQHPPLLEIEMLAQDAGVVSGVFFKDCTASRLRAVKFMVRLERFAP